MKTFYLKQWVNDDTFRRILSFSKFLGRDENGSLFEIDIQKARKNGLRASDIIGVLEELGVELNEKEKNELEEELPEYDVYFKISEKGYLLLEPTRYLGDLVKDLQLKYSKNLKAFYTYPYFYQDIVRKLSERGLIVKELDLNFKQFEVKCECQLRDYQNEAVKKWSEKDYKGVIALPTGSGKTIIGIKAIEILKVPTLVVTFTKDQMLQWKDTLTRFLSIRPEIGLYYSSEKKIKPITITTYQTAYKHIAELGSKFDFLIVDEAHHLPADKFRHIALFSIASKRLGLSATPFREDGKHEELFQYLGGLIFSMTTEELAKRNYLAPYQIIQVKVELKQDEKQKYLELLRKFRQLSKSLKIRELLTLAKQGDQQAIEALKVYNELRKLVNLSKSKLEELKEIFEKEKGKKILVFTQYVEQAKEIAKSYNTLLLTGEVSDKERKAILERFKRMQAGVLVLTTVGDEGLDIPDASVGVIVTGTGSRRQFIQRLGRLLRPKEGKVATLYEIIVKGTAEEYQSRRRKEEDLLQEFGNSYDSSDEGDI